MPAPHHASTRSHRLRALVVAAAFAAVGLGAAPALGAAPPWQIVRAGQLEITEGALAPAGRASLQTDSPKLRAVQRAPARMPTRALLTFRLRGPSTTIEPLGSGRIRQQIGLKLRASDPCNLVYAMWRSAPQRAVVVSVKRNPGQTTSAQCGNRGYTDIATIPLAGRLAADDRAHRLDVRTRALPSGALAVSVRLDRGRAQGMAVPAALAAGLAGPAGVRSDNGSYVFQLAAGR